MAGTNGFLSRYGTDQNLEEDGVWVDYGDGLKVKIRRINSKHSKDTRRRLEKPYTTQFRGREMPDTLQEEILNKQIAESLVVDWEGVPDPDDVKKPLQCTPANVLKVITNAQFKDFRDDILTASLARETYEKQSREEAAKN